MVSYNKIKHSISPRYLFDHIGEYHEGFAAVSLNNKWSFINKNNELIGDGKLWFDYVVRFQEGFTQIK